MEILKRQGTEFKGPKSAYIQLFEENMEGADIEAVEKNQSESSRVLAAINKKRQALQKGLSVTKQVCEQCSSQSLFHLVYKVLLDELEEALPNVAGLEPKL